MGASLALQVVVKFLLVPQGRAVTFSCSGCVLCASKESHSHKLCYEWSPLDAAGPLNACTTTKGCPSLQLRCLLNARGFRSPPSPLPPGKHAGFVLNHTDLNVMKLIPDLDFLQKIKIKPLFPRIPENKLCKGFVMFQRKITSCGVQPIGI